jgi:hypothetical protein
VLTELSLQIAAYSGTDLPTFRSNLLVSPSLEDIYRPLDEISVPRLRCHDGGEVQSEGQEDTCLR